jgi:hypothetical protein
MNSMKCKTRFPIVVVLAQMVLCFDFNSAFGCGPPTAVQQGGSELRDWGARVEGQAIYIATLKPAFHAGDPIILKMRLRNFGRESVTVSYDREMAPQSVFSIKVTFTDGKEVPLTLQGKKELLHERRRIMSRPTTITLKPGEEFARAVALSSLYDLSTAGEYVVSARRKVSSPRDENVEVEAASNTLRLTLQEPYIPLKASVGSEVIGQSYAIKVPALNVSQVGLDKAVETSLRAIDAAIADLIQQMKHGHDNEAVLQSAYMLGEMRAKAAVPALLAIIDFKAGRSDDYQIGVLRWKLYPAEEALVKIGNPAVGPITAALATEEDAARRKLMVAVLRDVLSKDVADFVLKKAADSATGRKKANYEQARRDLQAGGPK